MKCLKQSHFKTSVLAVKETQTTLDLVNILHSKIRILLNVHRN